MAQSAAGGRRPEGDFPVIVDSHTHMPSPGCKCPVESVKAAVARLRQVGTEAAIFNTWRGVFANTEAEIDEGNEAALALAREYAGFLYPGAVIHPGFPDASRRWLERFRGEGWLWVGELVVDGLLEKPLLDLFERCARGGHIVQLHNHPDVVDVAKKFPDMQVVESHIEADDCPRRAAQPNIWQDISGMVGGLKVGGLEAAYEAFGARRLLYGTDYVIYDPRPFMARVEDVAKDPGKRAAIFGGNLARLLEKAGARPIGGT
jgi:predicted TIM-barrel fold metal-dependent hydrolase